MSVARINMVDWRSEELFVEKTKNTASTMRQSFPNAEIMLRIKLLPHRWWLYLSIPVKRKLMRQERS